MRRAAKFLCCGWPVLWLAAGFAQAQPQLFPPPEFESGYRMPVATTPTGRAFWLQYLDLGVLAAGLGVAVWLVYKQRSRRGVFWLSLFSLAYFGFYRQGCICPIGSPQNIVYGLFHPDYAVPVTVIGFFALPLVVALFFGRAFCAGVCPQGALQDFFLLKPLKVPAWLEHGLGVVPYLFLGAGVLFAATGTGFVICRYDPFVPLFRRSGGFPILATGIALLVLAMFVGRPYCRFLCPYGALLKLAGSVSKWRVRVTPDRCTQCSLCAQSCPYGALREPSPVVSAVPDPKERRRLGWLLLLLVALVAAGAWAGAGLAPVAARLHPTVALAELYARQRQHPVVYGVMTPEALGLARVAQQPEVFLAGAATLRGRFQLATLLFGAWFGLVAGLKLVALALRPQRSDFEPDRGACLACARCFSACPNERVRLGLPGADELPGADPAPAN